MTPEIWTIIGVGLVLAILILRGQRSLRRKLDRIGGEHRATGPAEEARQISEPLAEAIESAKRMEVVLADIYEMVGLKRPEPLESANRKPGTGAKSHLALVEGRKGENVEQQ